MFSNLVPGTLEIKTDQAGAIALAKKHGWQGTDLQIVEAHKLATEHSPEYVANMFAEAGLRMGGWSLSINWREPLDKERRATLEGYAKLAQQLGCTRACSGVMPFSETLPFRENFDLHVERLKPVASILAEYGCRLGLEFIGPRTLRENRRYGFVYGLDGVMALAHTVGTNVGLLLDSWHWHMTVGAIADIQALRAEDVVYVHVNDAPPGIPIEAQQDLVRRFPSTTGIIDLPGFLGALRLIGYDGPLTPEPFEKRLASVSPDEAAAEAHQSMVAMFKAAGME